VGDVVGLTISNVTETNPFLAQLRTSETLSPIETNISWFKVLTEDALAFQMVHDFDLYEGAPEPGALFQNRVVSGSLLVTTRMKPLGADLLVANVQMARNGISEPVHLVVTSALANATRLQRGCQLRAQGVPVWKGPDGYYLLAMRESELTLAICENPIPNTAELATNAPTEAGAVVFNEIMTHSIEYSPKEGEWFELVNTTTEAVNLRGCELRRPKPNLPHVIAEDLILEPGQFAIVANTERPKNIYPDYVYYGAFGLLDDSGRTRAALTCNQKVIDMIDIIVRRVSGRSLTVNPATTDAESNDALQNWCWAPRPKADTPNSEDWSTPGKVNQACEIP
jgi:hypothetical protein